MIMTEQALRHSMAEAVLGTATTLLTRPPADDPKQEDREIAAALADAAYEQLRHTHVVIPRDQADALLHDVMCGVCLGLSPSWDGHDKNPPCKGAALDTIREQVA